MLAGADAAALLEVAAVADLDDSAAAWLASGLVAADAAPLAPNDLAIMPTWTAVIALRPQPPTTPADTAAPSTDGRRRYTTHGENPAIAKQVKPDSRVPSAAAPSAPSGPGVPTALSNWTPTINVIVIAGLASTRATVT